MTRDVLDVLHPYAGPCAICDGPDKRHRLADAVIEAVLAGEDPEMVAWEYDVTVAAVDALVIHAAGRRKRRKGRWS